jgi:hypothetical protein
MLKTTQVNVKVDRRLRTIERRMSPSNRKTALHTSGSRYSHWLISRAKVPIVEGLAQVHKESFHDGLAGRHLKHAPSFLDAPCCSGRREVAPILVGGVIGSIRLIRRWGSSSIGRPCLFLVPVDFCLGCRYLLLLKWDCDDSFVRVINQINRQLSVNDIIVA